MLEGPNNPVVMKHRNLFAIVLLALAGLANAQNTKPTMEQTVDFIQANYPKVIEFYAAQPMPDNGRAVIDGTINVSLAIAGTKIIVAWDDIQKRKFSWPADALEGTRDYSEQNLVSFDIKDIELIDGVTIEQVDELVYDKLDVGGLPMYLLFKAAGGKPLIEVTTDGQTKKTDVMWIPFAVDEHEQNHRVLREFKSWQLFKAIEHLRKLSGAPEPLQF